MGANPRQNLSFGNWVFYFFTNCPIRTLVSREMARIGSNLRVESLKQPTEKVVLSGIHGLFPKPYKGKSFPLSSSEFMEATSHYSKPPWVFKGRALYQLHLVKADIARALIPKKFRLVEAFGYTLGGFFLASYDDSPAGVFDELVVIAGLIWNEPTSCAWAGRVLVSSDEACLHGRKVVGLPSHVARFSKRIKECPPRQNLSKNNFLNLIGLGTTSPEDSVDVQVSELKGPAEIGFCTVNFATEAALESKRNLGPAIKITLPSFSGCTKHNPSLLKYSCKIECRVLPVKPAKVSAPFATAEADEEHFTENDGLNPTVFRTDQKFNTGRKLSTYVMLSKPIFALEFKCMKMEVDAPTVVPYK